MVEDLAAIFLSGNAVFSLGVGHCGVLDECEVVGDVLVVRQPPMGPNQAVLTDCHLKTATIKKTFVFTFP